MNYLYYYIKTINDREQPVPQVVSGGGGDLCALSVRSRCWFCARLVSGGYGLVWHWTVHLVYISLSLGGSCVWKIP
jgi:hypothetical protein